MNKLVSAMLLAAVTTSTIILLGSPATAQRPTPAPAPIFTAAPTFNCAVVMSNGTGKVTITKSNAVAVDKTKDVLAIVNTPNGKVPAAVCGSSFTSAAIGTSAVASFTVPASADKSWIYTCSAQQVAQTFACNPN